ncbi:MAG TPA: hypothetical protein VFU62_11420, partial [Hanamia sp.]|nr:hypothetical protein [Hanamia sp.]
MKITKIYITLLALFISAAALAQYPQAGNRPAGGRNMNMGHFYGKVIDGNTNKPIEAASVQLSRSVMDTVTKQRHNKIVAA